MNKRAKAFEFFILVVTGVFSFSIPCFSNIYPLNYFSVGIAVVLCSLILLDMLLVTKRMFLGFYTVSLVAFIFAIFCSQLLNQRMAVFPKSVLLMSIVALFIYQFARSHACSNRMFFAVLSGGAVFAVVFFVYYRHSLFDFGSRSGAFFNDQNQLARMVCVYAVCAFFMGFLARKAAAKIGFFLLFLGFVWVVLMTGSISNLLALVFTLFLSLFLGIQKWKNRLLLLGATGFLAAATAGVLLLPSMSYFRERIVGIMSSLFFGGGGGDASASERLRILVESFRAFLVRPVFGNGYFALSDYNYGGITGHNNFTQLLADTGILGSASFEFPFFLFLFILSFKKRRNWIAKALVVYLLVFQMFLSTYYQKIDYLIMPIIASVSSRELLFDFDFSHPRLNTRKERVLYILNNGFSSSFIRLKTFVAIENIKNLKALFLKKRKGSCLEHLFDAKAIVRSGPNFISDAYIRNAFYGHSFVLKRFSGYRGQVRTVIEHGLYFGDVFMKDEILDNPFRSIVTMSDYRIAKISKQCDYDVYPIGPYIAYSKCLFDEGALDAAKKKLGKTLLVFPSHSIKYMQSIFDNSEFVKEILKVKAKGDFKTVIISLYYQDLLNNPDVVSFYEEFGFLVTSCGWRENKWFLDRQRTLFELCDVSMSNSIGTHIGYSIYLGKPHYYFHQSVSKKAENGGLKAEYENKSAQADRASLGALFEEYSEEIRPNQLSACDHIFGYSCVKSPSEMKELLETVFLRSKEKRAIDTEDLTYAYRI